MGWRGIGDWGLGIGDAGLERRKEEWEEQRKEEGRGGRMTRPRVEGLGIL